MDKKPNKIHENLFPTKVNSYYTVYLLHNNKNYKHTL